MAFSSATSGWSFTLQSFAQLYADIYSVALDARELVSVVQAVKAGRMLSAPVPWFWVLHADRIGISHQVEMI